MPDNTFSVARQDIATIRTFDDGSATGELPDSAARLRVDLFSLTSNNVTYASFGVAMSYFDFFPAPEDSQGCIPAWGFAEVVESRAPGVEVGQRFYGFLPMSSHVVLTPRGVTEVGFQDGSAHRVERAPIYNQYVRCSTDPMYQRDREAQLALLRPLFSTAFLLDDFFEGRDYFGAEALLVSSASSKTAYATAFCLAQRRGTPKAVSIVGLTSKRNLEFTKRLGCYDEVLSYDAVGDLAVRPAAYVDMAGSGAVSAAVHERFGGDLKYSAIVGGTHWNQRGGGGALPGPTPTLFFAPSQAKARAAEWGAAGLAQRIASAWQAFMKPVCNPESPWLRVQRSTGLEATVTAYRALLAGTVPPDTGHVLSI